MRSVGKLLFMREVRQVRIHGNFKQGIAFFLSRVQLFLLGRLSHYGQDGLGSLSIDDEMRRVDQI